MERSLIAAVLVLAFVGLAYGVGFNENCSSITTCDPGLKCSATTNKCLRLLGGVCTNVSDCYVMAAGNGQCSSGNCTCEDKYVTNYDKDTCKLKAGETCTTTDQCAENSMCSTGSVTTCTCNRDFIVKDGRCAKPVGKSCDNSTQCSLMAECSSSSKMCACKTPYVPDGNFCTSIATEAPTTQTTTTQTSTTQTSTTQRLTTIHRDSGTAAVMASLLLTAAAFLTSQLF